MNIEFKGQCIYTSRKKIYIKSTYGKFLHVDEIPSTLYRISPPIPLLQSIFRIQPVYSQSYAVIKQFAPDIIIWRYNITYVPGIFRPKTIAPTTILVTEHQAKELEELRLNNLTGKIALPFIKIIRSRSTTQIDAMIGVTQEITSHELSLNPRHIAGFTLTNSIMVNQYPIKQHPPANTNNLNLLYIGSHTAEWQGLDRIIHGMSTYQGTKQIQLHIAGNINKQTSSLIKKLNLSDSIILHGYTNGEQLDKLFDMANIAIATLGLHRKKMSHASTLKVREYMARGIPFILSHIDEDVADDYPFIFNAPNDDSPIKIEEICVFYEKIQKLGLANITQSMHDYALTHMDYNVKLPGLLNFLKMLYKDTHLDHQNMITNKVHR